MQNYVQPGKTITMTAPYDRLSGEGALVGTIFGVAASDVLSGAEGEFVTEGVFDLARATGGSSAWTEGAAIYWDDTAKVVTKVSSANTLIGVGLSAVPGDSDATGRVRLNGSF